MTQFVIHVGPHKTGTTYLQEAFAHLRPYLAERGVHYPSLWGGVAHYQLYDELATIPNPALEAQFARLRTAGHPTVLMLFPRPQNAGQSPAPTGSVMLDSSRPY